MITNTSVTLNKVLKHVWLTVCRLISRLTIIDLFWINQLLLIKKGGELLSISRYIKGGSKQLQQLLFVMLEITLHHLFTRTKETLKCTNF